MPYEIYRRSVLCKTDDCRFVYSHVRFGDYRTVCGGQTLQEAPLYRSDCGNVCIVVSIGIPYNVRKLSLSCRQNRIRAVAHDNFFAAMVALLYGCRVVRSCGLRTCRRGVLEQKAYFARVHKRERGFASGRNMFLRAKRTRAAYQYRNEPPLRSCNRQGTFGRRKFLAEGLARRNRGKLPAASNRRKTYHRIRGRQSGIVQEIFARDRRKNRL